MKYNIKLKTDATVEPLTLAQLKAQLRVDGTDENDLITAFGKAARRLCERYMNRSCVSQTWTLKMDRFPSGRCFRLPRSPLISVTHIKYQDEDDAQQTLDSSKYATDQAGSETPSRVYLVEEETSWPDTLDEMNSVEVEFLTGYGTSADDVPETVKQAIRLLTGHFMENREAVAAMTVNELPFGVKVLLDAEAIYEAAED